MNENRGSWYLLTGLLIGLGLGLLISWVISPARYVDTAPEVLEGDYRDTYRLRVAEAYAANGNLERAIQRLALLNDPDAIQALESQSQRLLALGGKPGEAEALALLAADLRKPLPPTPTSTLPGTLLSGTPDVEAVQTATPGGPTSTPAPTFTPRPTVYQPTIGVPFVLKEKIELCETGTQPALLQVDVSDRSGAPLAGVRIDITWSDGADYFFTGLYPEISPGYADFQMTPGTVYRVKVGGGSEIADDLQAPLCGGADGQGFPGGWRLIFSEP